MFNKTLLLATKHQQPLLLENSQFFNIYIDESILFHQTEDKTTPTHFLTAFYVIEQKLVTKLNTNYQNTIYFDGSTKERKSNQVPDKINRLALEVAKKYMTSVFILERTAYNYEEFNDWKQNIHLTLELLSYIQPIQNILTSLKKIVTAPKIFVNVIIDRTTQNCIDPCQSFNQSFLQELAKNASDINTSFKISYQTADSQNSYGIQVADMLAGAYRKEIVYRQSDHPVKLIPFQYEKKILNPVLENNSDFLKIFGHIIFEQIPTLKWNQIKADEPINSNPSTQTITPPSRLHPLRNIVQKFKEKLLTKKSSFQNNLRQTQLLLKQLKLITDTATRQDTISLLIQLNNQFLIICQGDSLTSNYLINELSTKTDTAHYQKTIENIQRNLNLIKQKGSNHSLKLKIAKTLKKFLNKMGKTI